MNQYHEVKSVRIEKGTFLLHTGWETNQDASRLCKYNAKDPSQRLKIARRRMAEVNER